MSDMMSTMSRWIQIEELDTGYLDCLGDTIKGVNTELIIGLK